MVTFIPPSYPHKIWVRGNNRSLRLQQAVGGDITRARGDTTHVFRLIRLHIFNKLFILGPISYPSNFFILENQKHNI